MLSLLLDAYNIYKILEKDYSNGLAEEKDVLEAKKHISNLLIEFVDYRIKLAFEERRRSASKKRIEIAETINSTMKNTSQTIKSVSALMAAPAPPKDLADGDSVLKFFDKYKEWYNNDREKGISFK